MSEKLTEDEFSQWFSTYGVITSQRILGHYQINLPQKELLPAIKNANSFYHKLIQVPLKNVLNGIILQQANDYHIYTQKLFIDYLLSGESGKPPEAQGAFTRESLEDERKSLVTLGEQFNQTQLDHESLISITQKELIKLSKDLKECFDSTVNLIHKIVTLNGLDVSKVLVKDSLVHALIYGGIEEVQGNRKSGFIEKINEQLKLTLNKELQAQLEQQLPNIFEIVLNTTELINIHLEKVTEITGAARSYRTQFYNSVLRVIDLMKMLPDYKINPEQDAVNRESLYFDKSIGEAT